jgi:molecular chaperone GrpE
MPISAEGQIFDPNFHEAITNIPSDEHPADTVVTETRRSYLLGDKLLRAAQVIVSSGPAVPPPPSAEEIQPGDSGEKAP